LDSDSKDSSNWTYEIDREYFIYEYSSWTFPAVLGIAKHVLEWKWNEKIDGEALWVLWRLSEVKWIQRWNIEVIEWSEHVSWIESIYLWIVGECELDGFRQYWWSVTIGYLWDL